MGKGVSTAVKNVNEIIAPALIGMELESQAQIDIFGIFYIQNLKKK